MLIFSNVLNLMYLRGVLLARPFWQIVESMSSETIIWFRRINFHRVQEHVPYYNVVILQSKFKYFLGSTSYPARQMKSIAFYSHHVQWNNCHRYSTWGRQDGDTVKKELDTIEKRFIISISILQWKGIVCCHHLKFGRYNFHLCIAEHKRNGENLQDSLHIWKCAFCD